MVFLLQMKPVNKQQDYVLYARVQWITTTLTLEELLLFVFTLNLDEFIQIKLINELCDVMQKNEL